MKLSKEVLKHKYHLLNECNKNIERYTSIVINYSLVYTHVYKKLEFYKNKLIIITKNIEESENEIMNQVEKIIKEINEYMKNPNNYIKLIATQKYHFLKNNTSDLKNITNNKIYVEKETEISNEIERIFQIEKNIRKDLKSIYDFQIISKQICNKKFDDLLSSNTINTNHIVKIKELNNEIDNYYQKK